MLIPFKTFTDAQIDQIYFKNCVFLYKNAFISENQTMTNKVLENINKLSEPISIKSFLELLSTKQTEQLQILPYLWHEVFKNTSLIDMHQKITMSSLVTKGASHE